MLLHLYLYLQGVQIVHPVHDHQVMCRGAAHLQKRRLDLGREHVHAADDQHVVASAREPGDPGRGPAALTGAAVHAGQILGAVADQGNSLLGQGGDHQLSGDAVRHGPESLPVHDFRQEMVLVDM